MGFQHEELDILPAKADHLGHTETTHCICCRQAASTEVYENLYETPENMHELTTAMHTEKKSKEMLLAEPMLE